MSIATLILGQSGTGKSASLRNLDPKQVLLIQSIRKPLPFRAAGWDYITKQNKKGSILHTDNAAIICNWVKNVRKRIVIIDDFQYVMANEFMRRSSETSFNKFTEIGKGAWDIFNAAANAQDVKRVYILSHTEENDQGRTKIKTIGKMLDEKITLEGMVTSVLQTNIINDQYIFETKNNGRNTVKTPMGLFEQDHIANDLALVDAAMCDYYNIAAPQAQTTKTA